MHERFTDLTFIILWLSMVGHIKISIMPPSSKPVRQVVDLVIKALNPPPWNMGYRPYKVYRRLNPIFDSPNLYAIQARSDNGNLVGIALASNELLRDGAPYFLFANLCVDPAFHGKGVGRKLVQGVIDEARARGYKTILLGTLKGSVAESLYEKMGFEKFDAPWLKTSPKRQAMRLNLQTTSISPKA